MKASNLTELIQCHSAIDIFDYDIAVDWAIELITNGIESENILILASFSKPTDAFEIKPYVTAALAENKIEEYFGINAQLHKAKYHLNEILLENSVREQLKHLANLCIETEYNYGLLTFYQLYHGWDALDEIGVNFYFEGATKSNINRVVKEEATKWLNQFEEQQKKLPTTSATHKQVFKP